MAKSLKKKILSFLGMTIGGILIGISISFYIMLKLSVPVTDGEKTLNGIDKPIEITFDAKGIPQIWAETETDAYFALGYQHAADRMFHMDLARRIAKGELSDMLGGVAVKIDLEQKKIGHLRLAKQTLPVLSEDNKNRLDAYARGVNTYRQTCRSIPFEYRFLPVDFDPWTVEDCITLLSFQTWYSNSLMNRDLFYNKLVEKVGIEKAKTLLFPYPDWAPTTIDSDESISNNNQVLPHYAIDFALAENHSSSKFQTSLAEQYFKDGKLPMVMTEASNCWVVAPSHSESGKAMLASDPHLEISRLPQFWYAIGVHIKDKDINAFGITAPGLPFIVMGHNGQTAWAFTVGGTNVVDYTTLTLNKDNLNQYKTTDGWKDFEILSELSTPTEDSVTTVLIKQSDFGVVIKENRDSLTAYVMHWVGYDTDLNDAATNGFAITATSSFEQFRSIVTNFGALDANYMYADADGNIGYQLTAPLKVRDNEDLNLPKDYLTGKDKYSYYPLNETPHLLNPEKGWIASCNNKPERGGNAQGFYFADRIVSITELLESKDKFTVDDMYDFQFDQKDRYKLEFRDLIVNALIDIGETNKAEQMKAWDGSSDITSYEAALVIGYLDQLKQGIFEDELGELYSQIPAKWIENINAINKAGWFDDISTTDKIEVIEEISIIATQKTIQDTQNKTWGDLQTIQMQHPMAVIPLIGSLLDLSSEPEPHGGTPSTLNASFHRKNQDGTYSSVAGASMRFVIDFANPDEATIVLPAGNSGNPMSDHFFDFYRMWKNNERWNVPLSYEKVKEKAVSTLTLLPKEKEESN